MWIHEYHFSDTGELAGDLARSIAGSLGEAVAARGEASLVVSGGRTPRALFQRLSALALPWESVWITLADERWVAPGNPDSNETLVRETLLAGPAAAARFVGLKVDGEDPEASTRRCAAALSDLPRPFDVVLLGMGDDGHTASLFPGCELVAPAADRHGRPTCAAVRPPTAPHPRMSLTPAALLDSRRIVLLFTGNGKWAVYQKAREQGPSDELPVRHALHQEEVPVDVYWAP